MKTVQEYQVATVACDPIIVRDSSWKEGCIGEVEGKQMDANACHEMIRAMQKLLGEIR